MRLLPALVLAGCTATAALLSSGGAQADILHFSTVLSGSKEKVPNHVAATGTADVTLDTATHMASYRVDYRGLTGPAKIVHFHGPKLPGMRAPEVIVMRMHPGASPVTGSLHVTDAQIDELKKGQWYANVHTDKYPDGEIRGWLTAKK